MDTLNTESLELYESKYSEIPTVLNGKHREPPSDLADRKQWVVWQQSGDDKRPKVPWATGWSGKKWNQPPNWRTYHGLGDWPKADGFGYVLTKTPHAGIDLDYCRDPATGYVHEGARMVLGQLRTYAEVSPSETGIKALCRGEWPLDDHKFDLTELADDPDWSSDKTPTIEIYDGGRYFTITGLPVSETPHEITDGQETLDRLADCLGQQHTDRESEGGDKGDTSETPTTAVSGRFSEDLADRLEEARQCNETVDQLCRWAETDGAEGTPPYPDDRSRTECSLAWHLAYWFEKDKRAVERAMNRLNPPRWGESEWYNWTVLRAVDQQPESYQPATHESRPSRELVFSAWYELLLADDSLSTAEIADRTEYGTKQTRKALAALETAEYVRYERDGRRATWRLTGKVDDEGAEAFGDWIDETFNGLTAREQYLAEQNIMTFGRDRRAE